MKLGLFNLMTRRDRSVATGQIVADTVAMVRLAEDIGFDVAWFAEHHFSNYSICPSPLMMAAYCAGLTRRIRLGSAVLVLPLHNPARMVGEIGLLDVQSEGRAVIGIGSGYQAYEFDRFRRRLAEKTEVFMEVWDILESALVRGRLGYDGKHFQIPDSPLAVRPLQQPMPELYVTGLEPAVVERTARGGHVPFITAGWRGITLLREMHAHIKARYAAAGVPGERMPLAVQQYVFVTDDKAEALEIAERARYIGRVVAAMRAGYPVLDGPFIEAPPLADEPPLETFRDNLAIGDPHLVAEKLVGEVRELGTTHLSCFMQIGSVDGRRAARSLSRFGAEVIPLMEKAFGRRLEEVNAERTPSPPRRLAASA
jgi:alkanesulfonate monooxygenase SsuD/methylene tetrahydromethanopterin reductase-like flavin-dependent oxidoreductase (luciferase family)